MPYTISQKCVVEVYAHCQEVCPADCIHFVDALPKDYPDTGKAFMVIDPGECIDCGACKPACPIDAIIDNDMDDPYWSQVNKNLASLYRGKMGIKRIKNDPPRRSDNQLR